jgi:hypothetical protein
VFQVHSVEVHLGVHSLSQTQDMVLPAACCNAAAAAAAAAVFV